MHVRRNGNVAKFWLDPLILQDAGGFSRTELNTIAKQIQQHSDMFLERWNGFFEE
ncbi:MAG: DUF4160 domain-containing protein [Candidatus Latescibacteria bacterium]|nr:DUF4160 domain-containing protein [Candidatus Latescibacterota bacterium]